MKHKDQQSVIRRFFQSRLFLVITSLILLLIGFNYGRAYYEEYQVQQKIRELEQQVQSLQGKKLESLELLQYVKSDNFIEEKARTELNLKKPGENVVFVEGVPTVSTTPSLPSQPVDEYPLSNPQKWWYYFTRTQEK